MCGTVDHYEVVQSDEPITPGNFSSRDKLPNPPPPSGPGSDAQMSLPPSTSALERNVAVRAVDAAGNVGPPAILNVAAALAASDAQREADKALGGPSTGGLTGGSGPAAECAATTGFRSVSARAHGRGLAIGFAGRTTNPVTVDVFQTSVGRRVIGDRRVAHFVNKHAPFTWNGRGRGVGDGYFYVRLGVKGLSGKTDRRRITLVRRHGRFHPRPAHYGQASCNLLESFKLLRPAFGGSTRRPLGAAFQVTATARVSLEVLRGSRVIHRFPNVTARAGRTYRVTLSPRGLRPADYRFRLVARSGSTRVSSTLTSRRI
jgi:hypothetical protein